MNLELERFLESQTEMLGNLTITDSIDVETLMDICEEYYKRKLKLLGISDVSDILSDEVPNLFVTLAQQIHRESVINGLDMTSIIECFNKLQEAYKKERSITHCT